MSVTLTPRRRTMTWTATFAALALVAAPLAVAPAMASDEVVEEPTQELVIEEVTAPVEESVEEVVEEASQEVTEEVVEEPTEQVVEEPSQDSFVASTAPEKVWVCKVVASDNAPGGFVLKEGKNPIHVSVNALDGDVNPVPGAPFSDAQPSFIVAEDDVQLCLDGLPEEDIDYITVAWTMPEWVNSTTASWPQGIFDYIETDEPNLHALDDRLVDECGTQFQIDVYIDNEVTRDLIEGGFLLGPGNPPESLIEGGLGTAWKFVNTDDCPPPTAVDCLTTGSFLVTNENEQGFNYSPTGSPYADTRVDGSYDYVDGALRLTTLNANDASSTNKVSGARAVDIPLAEYGGDFTMNFVASYGTILPGINIRVDADNNGTNDVTLVAEPSVPGYLTFWTNTPGYLPASQGGQGGAFAGDQDDFLALWPDARVKVEAFALGSGVGTDGDLVSWSTPCNTYTYDFVEEPEEVTAYIDVLVEKGCGFIEYTFVNETDEPLGENQFARTVTWTYTNSDGEFVEFDQVANSERVTIRVDFDEDQGGGSVTSLAGEKGQQLREDDVDTDCESDNVDDGELTVGVVGTCLPSGGAKVTISAENTTEETQSVRVGVEEDDSIVLEFDVPAGETVVRTITLPNGLGGGTATILAGDANAPVAPTGVEVSTDCPPPVVDPPVLAYTGADADLNGTLLGGALALLLMGSAALVLRRRSSVSATE